MNGLQIFTQKFEEVKLGIRANFRWPKGSNKTLYNIIRDDKAHW